MNLLFKSLIFISLLFFLDGCCRSKKIESYTIEIENGAIFEVKATKSSLFIFNNGKPLVKIIGSGNNQFVETFANGVSSLQVNYENGKYEPTAMALALGFPENTKLITYDSNGHVKQEIADVQKFLEANADKLKQMKLEEENLKR